MKGKRKKDINYYLNLPWEIKLKKIPKEDGGGWLASIPLLGEWSCIGDGETELEAIENLKKRLKQLLQEYLKKGIDIPEPKKEEFKDYSGRILLRLPVDLHYKLATQAKTNNMSLNSYIIYLLSTELTLDSLAKEMEKIAQKIKSEEEEEQVLLEQELKQRILDKPWKPLKVIRGGKDIRLKMEGESEAA